MAIWHPVSLGSVEQTDRVKSLVQFENLNILKTFGLDAAAEKEFSWTAVCIFATFYLYSSRSIGHRVQSTVTLPCFCTQWKEECRNAGKPHKKYCIHGFIQTVAKLMTDLTQKKQLVLSLILLVLVGGWIRSAGLSFARVKKDRGFIHGFPMLPTAVRCPLSLSLSAHLWECLPRPPNAHWVSLRQQELSKHRPTVGRGADVRDHGGRSRAGVAAEAFFHQRRAQAVIHSGKLHVWLEKEWQWSCCWFH